MSSVVISLEDAITRLDALYVYTPEHAYALQLLKEGFELYRSTRKSVGIVVTGESRTGKSRLYKEFGEWLLVNHPQAKGLCKALIKMDVPDKFTRKDFAHCMLKASGDPFVNRYSTRLKKDDRFIELTREMDYVAIAIDEIQQLFKDKSENGINNAAQVIKYYFNNVDGFFIISGLTEIVEYILASSELTERFIQVIHLPKYELSRDDHIATVRSFLRKVAAIVPFAHECNVESDSMILRWIIASDGRIGRLVKITELACKAAIRRGHISIHLRHLAEVAATTAFSISGQDNPFEISDNDIFIKANEILNKKDDKSSSQRNAWEYADD